MEKYINQIIVPIVIAIIGSGGLFTFIQFLIGRHDKNFETKINDKIDKLSSTINYVAQGCTRTQLMFLMTHFPKRRDEIIKVAHHYFVDMQGNFYLGTLFKDYCKEQNIELPMWYQDQI